MDLIQQLRLHRDLSDPHLKQLIGDEDATKPLSLAADSVRRSVYGEDVYIRGLIEISNICKNDRRPCF